eukprot:1152800-Pelagomonas_calceolata.AAC.1
MDVGGADRVAQHDLHVTEQVSHRDIPPYLFDSSIPDQARRTSSRPDAILVTPCPADPNRPTTPPSHQLLRSMRCNGDLRSDTTPARQLNELNIQNRHIHLIEIKYREDTRPGIDHKGVPSLHKSSMPTLCNTHKSSSSPDVPLKTKTLNYGALGPHASRNPSDPPQLPSYPLERRKSKYIFLEPVGLDSLQGKRRNSVSGQPLDLFTGYLLPRMFKPEHLAELDADEYDIVEGIPPEQAVQLSSLFLGRNPYISCIGIARLISRSKMGRRFVISTCKQKQWNRHKQWNRKFEHFWASRSPVQQC